MSKQVVLPADVYDTLEFSALAYGGIGAGALETYSVPPEPVCFIGHLEHAGVPVERPKFYGQHPVYGITATDSDNAVELANRSLGDRSTRWERISFEEWCKRLHVVRGA